MFKYTNNNTNSNKKPIKVLFLVHPHEDDTTTWTTIKQKDKNGKDIYIGYAYDIWESVKKNLTSKYIFEETYFITKNYNAAVEKIADDEYDICIGFFGETSNRLNIVNFTTPVISSVDGILIKKENIIQQNKNVIRNILIIIICLLCLAFLSSIFFFTVYTKKNIFKIRMNKYFFVNMKKLFFSTIASSFGEHSFTVKMLHFTYRELLITLIMIMLVFAVIQFLQGEITASLITRKSYINSHNFMSYNYLGVKNWSTVTKMKAIGASITESELPINKLVEYFLNNNKYQGIVGDNLTLAKYAKYSQLEFLDTGFNRIPFAFIVNLKQKEFLYDVNKELISLKDSLLLQKICKTYFTDTSQCNLT
jgi:hypothetical protein